MDSRIGRGEGGVQGLRKKPVGTHIISLSGKSLGITYRNIATLEVSDFWSP